MRSISSQDFQFLWMPFFLTIQIPFVAFGLFGCTGGTISSSALSMTKVPAARVTYQPSPKALKPSAVPVHLKYIIPKSFDARPSSLRRNRSVALRHPEYISPSNTQLSIIVTPIGGSSSTYGPSPCTATTCTISFTANPGANTLAFTLTDGSGQTLSSFNTIKIIQPAISNTLNFSANPVVNSVTLQLASPMVNGGTAANVALTVNAMDADNNTIVGSTNFIDASGNPLSLTLNVINNQAGGRGTVSVQGPTVITAPGQAAIFAHYDGNWLASSAISVSSTSSAVTSLNGTTLSVQPTATEYAMNTIGHPITLTLGPDGRIWVACDLSGIGAITTTGSVSIYTAGITSVSYPQEITTGADGNLWFTEETKPGIARITPSGAVTEFSGATKPVGITPGPDGNLWFTDANANAIGRITPAGNITEFTNGISGSPWNGIVTGPDDNLWFVESNNKIGRISTAGSVTEFTGTSNSASNITSGPDGNLWFTERGGNKIGKISTSGSITEYSAGLTANADPVLIVSGPDNALWFGEDGGNKIGRITTQGSITEYGTGISAGASPQGISVGADGNIWFSEWGGKRIGKLVF